MADCRMNILEPDESPELALLSISAQNKGGLSVLRGGEWAQISFDQIDYIDCNRIKSHRAIAKDDSLNWEGYDAHKWTLPKQGVLAPDDAADCRMNILEPDEKPEVFYHSSISQHKDKLSVLGGGEWLPISYDEIDYIDCNRIHSHRAIVTDAHDIGFEFQVNEWVFYSDTYLTHDQFGVIKEKLSPWFGEGEFEKYIYNNSFINFDDSSLGHVNKEKFRIGLSYALAEKTLEADD